MAENSAISWTDHTFNPWWGCTKVGPGCDHCYAEALDKRFGGSHWGAGAPRRPVKDWSKPRKWNKRQSELMDDFEKGLLPSRPEPVWVFCASMADVFDNEVPGEWRDRLWALVRETPHLNWIFVTKRIGNAAKMLPPDWPQAFPHCGLCITVVNQDEADRDVPKLLATPATWRGVSAEPLLGPIDFDPYLRRCDASRDGDCFSTTCPQIRDGEPEKSGRHCPIDTWPDLEEDVAPLLDWIIVGGESGPQARPMRPAWARSIRDQCAAAGVAFHFKQRGEWLDEQEATRRHMAPGPEMFDRFGSPKGTRWHPYDASDRNGGMMIRVGKRRAGRRLDGVEHDAMPRLYLSSGARP